MDLHRTALPTHGKRPRDDEAVHEAGAILHLDVRKRREDGSKQLASIPRSAESHTVGGVEHNERVEAPRLRHLLGAKDGRQVDPSTTEEHDDVCRGLDGRCKVLKVSPVEGDGLAIRHSRHEVEALVAACRSSTAHNRMTAHDFGNGRTAIRERAANGKRIVVVVAGDDRIVSNDETV